MPARPLGITIIAILLAFAGVVDVIVGLELAGITSLGFAPANAVTLQGFANLVIGALTIIVSFGLFTLKRWAWLAAVIVLVLRILSAIWLIIASGLAIGVSVTGVGQLVLSVIVLWYFQRQNVRDAFDR